MNLQHFKIDVSFTHRGWSGRVAAFGKLLALLAVTGCAAPVEDGADISEHTEAIQNGETLPSELNGGTVLIQMLSTDNGIVQCTGQLISRDSILTAAHCIDIAGYYSQGWQSTVFLPVTIWHQNSNGQWENLTNSWETVFAFGREKYFTYRSAGNLKWYAEDLAVFRRSQAFWNVVPSDVSALARYIQHKPNYLYAYGHGAKSNVDYADPTLSRARLDNLYWPSIPNEDYLGTVLKEYSAADNVRMCEGDSGGPWKLPIVSGPGPLSGLQFGLHSAGDGLLPCNKSLSVGTRTAFKDNWIETRVTAGKGVCGHYTHVIHPWLGSSSTQSVNTLVCW